MDIICKSTLHVDEQELVKQYLSYCNKHNFVGAEVHSSAVIADFAWTFLIGQDDEYFCADNRDEVLQTLADIITTHLLEK